MSSRSNVRRGALLLAVALAAFPAWVFADESVTPPPDGPARAVAVSDDGRFVVSLAPSTSADRHHEAVWLLDRSSGEVSELAMTNDGIRDGRIAQLALSGDGCSVVVVTELALDLFRDDDVGDRWDAYRTVRPGCAGSFEPGTWELVSTNSDLEPIAVNDVDPGEPVAVDDAGDIVAIARSMSEGRDAVEAIDLTVVLGEVGRVSAVPGLPAERPAIAGSFGGQRSPAVSGDGRFVAFSSDAVPGPQDTDTGSFPSPAWTDDVIGGVAARQVWRWDRVPNDDDEAASVVLVSARPDGLPSSGTSDHPAVAGAGEVIAFDSTAPDLAGAAEVPDGSASFAQVFRATIADTVTVERVSVIDGGAIDGASSRPAIDDSGQLVAFLTTAANLVQPAPPDALRTGGADVVLADLGAGHLDRVTVDGDGGPLPYEASTVAISANGRVVVSDRADETADPLAAHIAATEPRLSAPDLDVGAVPIGETSARWYTTVTNEGDGTFVPRSITVDDPHFAVAGGSCTPLAALLPGATCTVEITFTPDGPGEVGAQLTVAERGFAAVALTVGLHGRSGDASISLSGTSVDLGTASINHVEANDAVVIVTAGDIAARSVGPVELAGTAPQDFRVVFDSCSGHAVPAGSVCHLVVRFRPTGPGARSATLGVLQDSGARVTAVLSGNGEYRPALGIAQRTAAASESVDVVGMGFPASRLLRLAWEGLEESTIVSTDGAGNFVTRLRVPASLGGGARSVGVTDPSGEAPFTESGTLLVTRSGTTGASPAHRRP